MNITDPFADRQYPTGSQVRVQVRMSDDYPAGTLATVLEEVGLGGAIRVRFSGGETADFYRGLLLPV
jgi:hypothetical protein